MQFTNYSNLKQKIDVLAKMSPFQYNLLTATFWWIFFSRNITSLHIHLTPK